MSVALFDEEIFFQRLRSMLREEVERVERGRVQLDPPTGMTRKPLYKIKEVCVLFSISKPTVYEWVKAGKLHPVKVRSRVYFRGSEVEGLFEIVN